VSALIIIIVHGSCKLGCSTSSLDSLIGVIPMVVFPVCWYDICIHNIVNIYIYIYCAFVGLDKILQ
jgi:hypothetical protein